MKSKLCLIALISLILVGCGTTGKMKIVEESGSKGNWVKSDKDYFEKNNKMYFRAMVTDRKDLAHAKREAKAEAIKNIAEKVNIKVRTEFEEATRGSNVADEGLSLFTSDVVAWVSENLNIQGISPTGTYWQRVEELTREGYKYSYNVYILCEIPTTDYEKARSLAIKNLLRKYQDVGDKLAEQAAEEVKKRLLKE